MTNRGMRQPNSVKRAERDQRIVAYYLAHPGISLRRVGRIYKLSHQMIKVILDKNITGMQVVDTLSKLNKEVTQ